MQYIITGFFQRNITVYVMESSAREKTPLA